MTLSPLHHQRFVKASQLAVCKAIALTHYNYKQNEERLIRPWKAIWNIWMNINTKLEPDHHLCIRDKSLSACSLTKKEANGSKKCCIQNCRVMMYTFIFHYSSFILLTKTTYQKVHYVCHMIFLCRGSLPSCHGIVDVQISVFSSRTATTWTFFLPTAVSNSRMNFYSRLLSKHGQELLKITFFWAL